MRAASGHCDAPAYASRIRIAPSTKRGFCQGAPICPASSRNPDVQGASVRGGLHGPMPLPASARAVPLAPRGESAAPSDGVLRRSLPSAPTGAARARVRLRLTRRAEIGSLVLAPARMVEPTRVFPAFHALPTGSRVAAKRSSPTLLRNALRSRQVRRRVRAPARPRLLLGESHLVLLD